MNLLLEEAKELRSIVDAADTTALHTLYIDYLSAWQRGDEERMRMAKLYIHYMTDGLCWACALGRCGQGPYSNLCTCCRNGHK